MSRSRIVLYSSRNKTHKEVFRGQTESLTLGLHQDEYTMFALMLFYYFNMELNLEITLFEFVNLGKTDF